MGSALVTIVALGLAFGAGARSRALICMGQHCMGRHSSDARRRAAPRRSRTAPRTTSGSAAAASRFPHSSCGRHGARASCWRSLLGVTAHPGPLNLSVSSLPVPERGCPCPDSRTPRLACGVRVRALDLGMAKDGVAPPGGEFEDDVASQLLAYMDMTSDLVGVVDDHSRLVYLNEAARKRLGVGDPTGLTTADLFPPHVFAVTTTRSGPRSYTRPVERRASGLERIGRTRADGCHDRRAHPSRRFDHRPRTPRAELARPIPRRRGRTSCTTS